VPGRPVPVPDYGYLKAVMEMLTVLTPNEKRVYRRILELDRPHGLKPGGCFASVAMISQRLNIPEGNVRKAIRKLLNLGLLVREGVKRKRLFATVPPGIEDAPPSGMHRGREYDAWLLWQAPRLEAALRRGGRPRNGAEIWADIQNGTHRAVFRPKNGGTNYPKEKDKTSYPTGQIIPPIRTNHPIAVEDLELDPF
jgi:hypothetical protein